MPSNHPYRVAAYKSTLTSGFIAASCVTEEPGMLDEWSISPASDCRSNTCESPSVVSAKRAFLLYSLLPARGAHEVVEANVMVLRFEAMVTVMLNDDGPMPLLSTFRRERGVRCTQLS